MIVPSGTSNGEEGPKSSTNPVFLDPLCHVTVVPTFTQKGALPLASGMFGVVDAELLLRFTFTTQGLELEPHVVLALHMLPGFDSEQTYFLLLLPFNLLAETYPVTNITEKTSTHHIAALRCIFMSRLNEKSPSQDSSVETAFTPNEIPSG
jgi:hypothetical protein